LSSVILSSLNVLTEINAFSPVNYTEQEVFNRLGLTPSSAIKPDVSEEYIASIFRIEEKAKQEYAACHLFLLVLVWLILRS
jgi:hypothetical protein